MSEDGKSAYAMTAQSGITLAVRDWQMRPLTRKIKCSQKSQPGITFSVRGWQMWLLTCKKSAHRNRSPESHSPSETGKSCEAGTVLLRKLAFWAASQDLNPKLTPTPNYKDPVHTSTQKLHELDMQILSWQSVALDLSCQADTLRSCGCSPFCGSRAFHPT